MLTGDSLREDSHASPPLATPQTPGILASLTALCRGGCMEWASMGAGFGERGMGAIEAKNVGERYNAKWAAVARDVGKMWAKSILAAGIKR